jgi:riboflavin synthase
MFSGLIAHSAVVAEVVRESAGGIRLTVQAPEALAAGVEIKDSIAINGVCLTAVALGAETIAFDVVPETLARTDFANLAPGDMVNLELSLRMGDRLGGHLVYGHVDANAAVVAKIAEGQGHRITIERPASLAAMIVEKGYMAVDGVSLTVASVTATTFDIALIPETFRRTTLGPKGVGARVNLEVDPVARYALGAAQAYAALR